LKDIFFVSLGALLGSNVRFAFYKKLEQLNFEKDFITLIINTFSSFFVGFSISYLPGFSSSNTSFQLVLFFQIGFLGSLSTFSTFIYDLFELLRKVKYFKAVKLSIYSIVFGIIAFTFGFVLGNQQ
tara:strand:+ start:114 stop:491 length:378 start_codon:yes stop_codon:yes gene_type:complete